MERPTDRDTIILSADDFAHGPTTVWRRPDGSTYTTGFGDRRYEVHVEGEEPRTVSAAAVLSTWGESVPEFANALRLRTGSRR